MRASLVTFLITIHLVAACGGGKTPPAGGGGAGGGGPGDDTHATPPPDGDDPAAAGDPDAGVVAAPEPPKPPATLVFKNESAKQELTFAIDKGWGTTVFAYSGKPPKAKTALIFPRNCTASCDAAAEEMCPICKEAEDPKQRQKDEKAETKREIVGSSSSFAMEWDGLIYAYEKATVSSKEARGRNKKCECWRKVTPEPETYTIKACGLRAAKKVGAPSTMQCVEASIALPLAGTGNEIVLAFP